MDIVGALPAKINGKYAVTMSDISYDANIPTKVHRGPFGNFGTSQAPEGDYSLSFKVSVPKAGLEFDFQAEFAKDGANITFDPPVNFGFSGVKLSKDGLSVDNTQGVATVSCGCTAEHRVLL